MSSKKLLLFLSALTLIGLGIFGLNNTIVQDKTPSTPSISYKTLTPEHLAIIKDSCSLEIASKLQELRDLGDNIALNIKTIDRTKIEKFLSLRTVYENSEKPSDPICTVALSPADSYLSTSMYLFKESLKN